MCETITDNLQIKYLYLKDINIIMELDLTKILGESTWFQIIDTIPAVNNQALFNSNSYLQDTLLVTERPSKYKQLFSEKSSEDYQIIVDNNVNVDWYDIYENDFNPFDYLPDEAYNDVWYPIVKYITDEEDRPNMDKIGGNKPFIPKGEKRIPRLRLLAQLTLPKDDDGKDDGDIRKTIQVWENFGDNRDLRPIIAKFIDYSQPFEEDPVMENYGNDEYGNDERDFEEWMTSFNLSRVIGWEKNKELIGRLDDIDSPLIPFAKERYLKWLDWKYDSKYYPRDQIKYKGTPQTLQGFDYPDFDLQIGVSPFLNWAWGNQGIIHINVDTLAIDGDMN